MLATAKLLVDDLLAERSTSRYRWEVRDEGGGVGTWKALGPEAQALLEAAYLGGRSTEVYCIGGGLLTKKETFEVDLRAMTQTKTSSRDDTSISMSRPFITQPSSHRYPTPSSNWHESRMRSP